MFIRIISQKRRLLIRRIDLDAPRNQTKLKMKTFIYSVHFFLLAILLVGVTACGSPTDDRPTDADLCSDPALSDFEERPFSITLPDGIKWNGTGDETNFDLDLGIIYLAAASEGPDDEPIGTLTLLFEKPKRVIFTDSQNIDRLQCKSHINSATLSTTDARRGTAEETNGKLYGLLRGVSGECELPDENEDIKSVLHNGDIEFFYVSKGRADGWFCVGVEEISPGSGEPFLIAGSFAIRNR